ncbi:uncharacterized protein SOCE26_061550 [Sorangium cellulosum]|uniref:Glycine zipper domain-containing protein n=1 Tax=Sorangium cellulosum TaxID=56 RepID=A0A2L0EZF3_SORCE|nr:hypothetical protein [Sorangium cellulosum]AUX44688.1 uncharacterized protein SOCE26_061550 [Sorangium cellulosum]
MKRPKKDEAARAIPGQDKAPPAEEDQAKESTEGDPAGGAARGALVGGLLGGGAGAAIGGTGGLIGGALGEDEDSG